MLITPVGNLPSNNNTHFRGNITKNIHTFFEYSAEREINNIPNCPNKRRKQIIKKWEDLYQNLSDIIKNKVRDGIDIDVKITQTPYKPEEKNFGPITATYKEIINGKNKIDLCVLTRNGQNGRSYTIGYKDMQDFISSINPSLLNDYKTALRIKSHY